MMTLLTVEPPEYYPVVDKFFATGIKDALDILGIELTGIDAVVGHEGRTLKIDFVFKVGSPETFIPLNLDSVVSALLDKFAADATNKFGRLYDLEFRVAGFRIVHSGPGERKGTGGLIVNCPEDSRRALERLGRGLLIYLKENRIDFSSVVLSMPSDGRPTLTVVLILRKKTPQVVKESLAENLGYKARSYLRTLGMDYISVNAAVMDFFDDDVAAVIGAGRGHDENTEGPGSAGSPTASPLERGRS
ncbi:hypothetical protein E3E36_00330 [Thermococcus sp. M36]|uniref:hypothetical protein n=1 Tax=Thermococcus sp. M36 TaxID=1638261 RepID=UPI00143B2FC3|nr:hypothetical protein [Thermococcus sp. M36]NJE04619.1 hypothetical protein [Thermococcus sp. M36]